jgi:hypothetical protein
MHVCVLDGDGQVALDRNLPCRPEAFLRAVAPFRDGLVVGAECLFAWYGLADLCQAEGIPFVLGHQLGQRGDRGGRPAADRLSMPACGARRAPQPG